jgi:hypothetical protein
MMFTTRFWSSTAALLCALLLQNCRSNSLRATDEEEPAASSSSAMHQDTSGEPLAMLPSTSLNASPTAHVSSSRLSTTLADGEALSTAPSVLATVSNSPKAFCNLPTAAMPEASRAVPSGDESGHALSPDTLWWGSIGGLNELEEISIPETFIDEEASKQPAQQRYSDQESGLANKKVHCREGVESDKAVVLSAFLGPAAQQDQTLDGAANASLDMFSACFPYLRAAAKAEDKDVRLLALKTLGEVEWRRYFGEVGPVPDLPSDMATILDSTCPFWPGKKVRDTHLLVLIPAKVNGQSFSLNLLCGLIRHPRNGGHETQYWYYGSDVQVYLGASSPAASYWLLMTRDVLPESRSRSYRDQEKMVADHASRTRLPYEVPSVLEAATAILMHHVRDGERLYSSNSRTYTRCQELIYGAYPAVVGGFEPSGLRVGSILYDSSSLGSGVAGCRKFF